MTQQILTAKDLDYENKPFIECFRSGITGNDSQSTGSFEPYERMRKSTLKMK